MPLLPAGVLATGASMLRPSPANIRLEKPASRDNLSLAHIDCFFRAAAVRSPLLAYRFEALLNQFLTRSVRHSLPQALSRSGEDLRALPVAKPFLQHSRSFSGSPLPSGLLHPRDRCAQSDSNQEACLCDSPDLRSLPVRRSFFNRCRPDHRSRSATSRQAC